MKVPQEVVNAFTECSGDFTEFHKKLREEGFPLMDTTFYHIELRKANAKGELTASFPVVAEQPSKKRTALVVLEVELEDYEDTYQTAELLVELLNNDFNNQFSLVAATDKIIV